MEILNALLPKDYHLQMDFFDNYTVEYNKPYIFPFTYKSNIFLIKRFYENKEIKIKLREIIEKFNKDIAYMILETEKKTNKIDLFSDCLDEMFHMEESYSDRIINEIKDFYKKYFNRNILVSDNNLTSVLDSMIDLNENDLLKKDYQKVYDQYFNNFNERIGFNIVSELKNNLYNFNLNIPDSSFDFLRKKLHIFFKIVGRDFIKMIEEPMKETDTFNLLYAKINKNFFRVCRMELLDLKNDKYTSLVTDDCMVLILFMLCVDVDLAKTSSLIKVMSHKFKTSEKKYTTKSIEIHKNINF